jgi:hypothetical protein
MASKSLIEERFRDYDRVLELFLPEMEGLARGVRLYCEALKEVVTVVGIFHGFEADLPGRCKGGGTKLPANCLGQHCPVCEEEMGVDAELLRKAQRPKLRDSEAYRATVLHCDSLPKEAATHREALLSQVGLSRISGLFPAVHPPPPPPPPIANHHPPKASTTRSP